jgi:hypothetical protein
VLDFEKGAPTTVVPLSSSLAFLQDGAGKATSLVLNPGPWQIAGQRIN